MRVICPEVLWAGLAASVAWTVRVELPAVAGVPLTEQLLPRVSPAGSVPAEMEQV